LAIKTGKESFKKKEKKKGLNIQVMFWASFQKLATSKTHNKHRIVATLKKKPREKGRKAKPKP
jgi:hypothetical protein